MWLHQWYPMVNIELEGKCYLVNFTIVVSFLIIYSRQYSSKKTRWFVAYYVSNQYSCLIENPGRNNTFLNTMAIKFQSIRLFLHLAYVSCCQWILLSRIVNNVREERPKLLYIRWRQINCGILVYICYSYYKLQYFFHFSLKKYTLLQYKWNK